MALTKEAKLEALRTGMRGEFLNALNGAEKEWVNVARVIPSSTGSNAYGWLGDFPQLQEWVSDRVVRNMKEYGFTVANKNHEATLGIKRTDLEDDNLGMYGTMASNLGSEVIRFQNVGVFGVLKNGDATLIYDGQNLFDTDHPVYPKTDGTGTAKSVSNVLGTKGSKPAWYVLDTSKVIKPVILQERTSPEFEHITNTQQDHVFIKDEYLVGIRYRVAFTGGLWQLSVKSYEDLTADGFNKAFKTMSEFTAHGGRPLGITPTVLVVPPSLRADALGIINAQYLANGASNTNFQAVKVIVSPYL